MKLHSIVASHINMTTTFVTQQNGVSGNNTDSAKVIVMKYRISDMAT